MTKSTSELVISSSLFERSVSRSDSDVRVKSKSHSTSPVRSSDENVHVNLTALDVHIKSMVPFAHVKVYLLEREIMQRLEEIKKLVGILHGTNAYPNVVEIAKKNFGHIENVEPETVAAYFRGCFVSGKYTSHKGTRGCSATCAGAMPVPDVAGWQNCDQTVFIYDQGRLNLKCRREGTVAVIHVIDRTFIGFTHDQIKVFREHGITDIVIQTYSVDGTHEDSTCSEMKVAGLVAVDRSCASGGMINGRFVGSDKTQNIDDGQNNLAAAAVIEKKNYNNSWWWWVWLVVIVLIVLAIILFAWLFIGLGKKKNVECSTTDSQSIDGGDCDYDSQVV